MKNETYENRTKNSSKQQDAYKKGNLGYRESQGQGSGGNKNRSQSYGGKKQNNQR